MENEKLCEFAPNLAPQALKNHNRLKIQMLVNPSFCSVNVVYIVNVQSEHGRESDRDERAQTDPTKKRDLSLSVDYSCVSTKNPLTQAWASEAQPSFDFEHIV